MTFTIMPNTGILGDDSLDRLRGEAIVASQGGLPEQVVYYLRAIERRYMDMKNEQKLRALTEIGWPHVKPDSAEGN